MPETLETFDDLPVLQELRSDLARACGAQDSRRALFTPTPLGRRSSWGPRLAAPWPRRRPRILAGSALGLAAAAAALTLALSGAASAPAFAVTTEADGSVLVTLNTNPLGVASQLAAKLAAMGIGEEIEVATAPGPATVSGPVSCQPGTAPGTPAGVPSTPAGPPVEVLLGTDGTLTIPSGNTGAGTVHVSNCIYYTTPQSSSNSGTTTNAANQSTTNQPGGSALGAARQMAAKTSNSGNTGAH